MISVIIPAHNRKKNVELALTALRLQTLPKEEFEVILIDDGSTDGTYQLMEVFKDEFRFKYAWINKKNAWNASRPRNFGAKIAEKESVAFLFLDSDIILNREALQFYFEDFKKNKNRVIIGPYNWLPPQGFSPKDVETRWDDVIQAKFKVQFPGERLGHIGDDVRMISFNEKPPDQIFNEIFDGLACFGGNLLVPRDIFWKCGGYDEDTHCGLEDGEFGIRLWKNDIAFSYDKRCLGYHVWHKIPPARFPPNLKVQIDKLNLKHFKKIDPDLGLVNASKEAYKRWGIDWQVPPEWER